MVTKNKLAIPVFVDEEGIPMVHQDEDDDDYEMPNTSRVETSFTSLTSFLILQNQHRPYDELIWVGSGLEKIQKKEPQCLSSTTVVDGFL